eukprot:scaffold425_cov365-Pavlova_lutheri.AAC.5
MAASRRRRTPIHTSARSRCAAMKPMKSPTSSSNCLRSILRSSAHPTRDGMALPLSRGISDLVPLRRPGVERAWRNVVRFPQNASTIHSE